MKVLAIDVGSSSVKAGVLRDGNLVGGAVRQGFPTRYDQTRAEVDAEALIGAVAKAAQQLRSRTKGIDCISLATMAPSWVAMDRRGRAITPIVTHQDRRSLQVAMEIERRVGKARHLKLAGNRPIPGGISSTTCAWFIQHHPSLMRRADLVGHVQTLLHRRFCGSRVVDPSHASFMGLYSTVTLGGWNDELCETIGIARRALPEVRDASEFGGALLPDAARRLGVASGMPMLVGMIDTGAAMLLAGAKFGQIVNVVGSTDVLALCTDRPKPHERLLLRGLGVGRKWVTVGTIAAAGSSLVWARQNLFAEMSDRQFFRLVDDVLRNAATERGGVRFDPYLAGDRCSVEQRRGSFNGLTLSTTRRQMLAAIIDALAVASADRIALLKTNGVRMSRHVMTSGAAGSSLSRVMQRDWPGRWTFRSEAEATLRGLALLPTGRPARQR